MLNLYFTNQFKKDYKAAKKRNLPLQKLESVLAMLQAEQALPESCRDHALTGNWQGFRECHIQPDWLLIYRVDGERLELVAQRTGSHADLFT